MSTVSNSAEASAAISRGLTLMTIAMLVIPAMDIIAKSLSGEINGIQVAQARFGFQFVLLAPIVLWQRGLSGLVPNNIAVNLLRGVLMAAAVSCFFTALRWMPVPDAIAIFFVEPLILTLLSALFLGEKVGWRRISAIVVGFIGALIVIQPSYEVFGLVSLLPVCAATFFAFYLMLTSKLSRSEDAMTMQAFSGLVGLVALGGVIWVGGLAGVSILGFVWPTPEQWLLLTGVGVIATVCHMLIVHAFRRAPASVLAPFNYLEIVSATGLSYLVFADVPGPEKWLGIAIIVASGLYVFWRERQVKQQAG